MKKSILFLLTTLCVAAFGQEQLQTINTLSGESYPNATVEKVNPDGIDIGYVDNSGRYILRGLKFTDLPTDIQKKYGYDPKKAQEYATKVAQYNNKNMEKVAEDEEAKVKAIVQSIKDKMAGQDVTITTEELHYAIQSARCSVEIKPLEYANSGTIVEIVKLNSGRKPASQKIILDEIKLPLNGTWNGFLYPTGLKANYNNTTIPVYTEDITKAESLLQNYLEIYSQYAQNNGDATDISAQDAVAPNVYDSGSTTVDIEDYDHYDYPVYYIGPSYRPYYWWRRNPTFHHKSPNHHHNNKPNVKPNHQPSHKPNVKPNHQPSHKPNVKPNNNKPAVNNRPQTNNKPKNQERTIHSNVNNRTIKGYSNLRQTTPSSGMNRAPINRSMPSHTGGHRR